MKVEKTVIATSIIIICRMWNAPMCAATLIFHFCRTQKAPACAAARDFDGCRTPNLSPRAPEQFLQPRCTRKP